MSEGARSTKRSLAGATADGYASPGLLDPRGGSHIGAQGARISPGHAGRGAAGSAPTADAALDRFYLYVDETNAPGGLDRWQRMQQLADELRKMGPAGADVLLQVLEAGATSEERRAAAQLLGELQIQQALPLLQNIVEQDSDVPLRRAATAGLRRLQTPETVPVLEALLADSGEDRLIRMSAASGLAQMDRSQGVAGLMQVFESPTADISGRALAFRALTSLNDERALPFMRRLVTSTAEASYRVRAMRFLSGQGDQQALPSLQQVMQSPAEPVSIRDAAAQAHAAMCGQVGRFSARLRVLTSTLHRHREETVAMPLQSRYVFSAAMDVEPSREAIFNEVYDTEHVPILLGVPGVLSVARVKVRPLTMVLGGEKKTIVFENEPRYNAFYEIESPEVLTSEAWGRAVDQGRWTGEVRPYTKNRRHILYERLG